MRLSKLIKSGIDKVKLSHWNEKEHIEIKDKNNILFSLLRSNKHISINEMVCNEWEPYLNDELEYKNG